MRGGRVSPIRDRQDCALIWHSPYISQKKFWRKLMTPSKINQNELDELMDKAVRKGVAAAILAAQDAGLVKFPVPLFGLKDAEERIDGIAGTFIAVVRGMDQIGRATCRERMGQEVESAVVGG